MPPIIHSTSLFLIIIGLASADASPPLYDTKTNTTYPFQENGQTKKDCGDRGLELICPGHPLFHPVIEYKSDQYFVLHINQGHEVLTIVRGDIFPYGCLQKLDNISFNENLFAFAPTNENLTFVYNCTTRDQDLVGADFGCERNDSSRVFYNGSNQALSCKSRIQIPVRKSKHGLDHGLPSIKESLKNGFDLKYKGDWACIRCRGRCFQSWGREFLSCAPEGSQDSPSNTPTPGLNKNQKIGIGVGCLAGVLCLVLIIYLGKRRGVFSKMHAKRTYSGPSSRSDVEAGSVYFGVPVYSYTELEEATNNFDVERELGDGGFGTVYYGKLRDGREVAIKRLYEHNYKRVAQFMNEVEILTRLRHRNLVSLYGCTSKRSRELLLVYEYIPNGTVADHIHGDRATPGSPPWPTRMSIAIETASALAYLHASEIIHRDVKTNNILLDHNFCVKVADFGICRLFPFNVTHVSTAPQGTPGYVDPEYYQCYQLSTKSDVYSFGVVLIELISSLPAVDLDRHRHDINLASVALRRIERSEYQELIDSHLGFEWDKEVQRMTISVAQLAFRCIQHDKELRPSMDEVLEVLKQIQKGNEAPDDRGKAVDDDGIMNIKPPTSQDSDEAGLLKATLLPPSPNSVTDDWTSNSTTPNISC